jgi:RepB DNA-primase from phage plasmid
MSNSITMQSVQSQIKAMGVSVFEIGAYKAASDGSVQKEPEMLLRTWDSESLVESIGWLRLQNLQSRNIYVRPKGEHPLSLLDDLTFEGIEQMKAEGFHPAVVVETSPGNFQAWVNHGELLPKELSTSVARVLSQKFQADPSSADWRHFGRLAGFTNRKQKHQQPDGFFPFVKLIEASGEVYPQAKAFVPQVRQAFDEAQRIASRQPIGTWPRRSENLRTITDFRNKPEYQDDGNRIDLAYAVYALSHGVPESDVRAAIASRDLSHKGSHKRQTDYLDRTVLKAWTTIRGQARER